MDVHTLLADSKARFNHNSAKVYLTEKYTAKLIVADQGGLWLADQQLITALLLQKHKSEIILIDTFGNPVKVNREQLLIVLDKTYDTVMEEWYNEWKELETKR